jgi:hypothetical protein
VNVSFLKLCLEKWDRDSPSPFSLLAKMTVVYEHFDEHFNGRGGSQSRFSKTPEKTLRFSKTLTLKL